MTRLPDVGTPAQALALAQAEADQMRRAGVMAPLAPVHCACGAGCTDGVCTAQEAGDR